MPPTNIPLSVCVITLNEEDNIGRCLDSVQWADDIVVVDSGSDDHTLKIAKNKGARTLEHEWEGHVKQKQFATDQAEHEWVLSLDADEEVSDELAESIQELFEPDPPSPDTTFEVNRLCYFLGQWIRHGSWHPDWIVRLFNRTETEWGGTDPHDRVLPANNRNRLDGHLYHYPYESIADNVRYGNYYSSIQAQKKHQDGETGGALKAITHSGFKFFKDYILKRGFLDGQAGLFISTVASFDVFCKYAKLWEQDQFEPYDSFDYPKGDSSS
ncbi:MAG: glycosyltransferase family 2 protein [bacterium]